MLHLLRCLTNTVDHDVQLILVDYSDENEDSSLSNLAALRASTQGEVSMDSDSYLIILEIFMSANLQALHRFHEANSVDIGAIVAAAEPPGPDYGAISTTEMRMCNISCLRKSSIVLKSNSTLCCCC